jgi:hypothetical protein
MKKAIVVFAMVAACAAPEIGEGGAPLLFRSDDECPVATATLDIDVPRVQLSGDFRINGATPIAYDAQSGIVELRSAELGVAELGPVHAGSYDRWVIPGVYDVVYRHTDGDIVPQNAEKVLLEGVSIAGGTLDIDIESVLVMGAITLNGGPAPASVYERGQVRLRDRKTGATFTVGDSLDGEYFAMVIPGTYDVVWKKVLGGGLVPANGDAVILENVVVDGLTELDIDIPAVLRTGEIRVNGAPAPASIYENGTVSLRDVRTGDVVTLGQTRHGTYEKVVVPGTYDVLYSHLLGDSIVPRNEKAVIAKGVVMTAAGAFVIDIPSVTLQGSFSLDGGAFPASAYNRAKLWLQGAEEGDAFPLGTTNAAGYQVKVVPGSYDVLYQKLISTGLVPENGWSVVLEDQVVPKVSKFGTTIDIPVTSALVGAGVTVWGQPPLASVYENADISAVAGSDPPVHVGQTRDGGGIVRLLARPYAFHYTHLIGGIVPANKDARVGEGAPGVATQVDLRPGSLHGDFTQGGQAFPASGASGTISLRDTVTGDLIELGSTTDGGYDLSLLGGHYEIVYSQVSGRSVVANRNARLGCVELVPPAPLQVVGLAPAR